jgi:Bor protein
MKRLLTTLLVALAVNCIGCATTTIRSGRPPLDAAAGYDERWNSAFLWGGIPAGDPYDLAQICPHGWSQVTVGRDPLTMLIGLSTLFIYSPSRITVVCAIPAAKPLPPAEGYAPGKGMPSAPGGS